MKTIIQVIFFGIILMKNIALGQTFPSYVITGWPHEMEVSNSNEIIGATNFRDSITIKGMTFNNKGKKDPNLPNNHLIDQALYKLNSNGQLGWSKHIYGNGSIHESSKLKWNNGNIYHALSFSSKGNSDTLFYGNTVLKGSILNSTPGDRVSDLFMIKLDDMGNITWNKRADGKAWIKQIETDTSDNVYFAGEYFDTLRFENHVLSCHNCYTGDSQCFIIKMDENGNLIWAKSWGGNDFDYVNDLVCDNENQIYVSGGSLSNILYLDTIEISNPFAQHNMADGYLAKMDSDGSFIWAVKSEDLYEDGFYDLAVDNTNLYTIGNYNGYSLTISNDTLITNPSVSFSFFIAAFNKNSGNLKWITQPKEGEKHQYANNLQFDKDGSLLVGGSFHSNHLTLGETQLENYTQTNNNQLAESDVFYSRLTSEGEFKAAFSVGGKYSEYHPKLFQYFDDYIFTSGYQSDSIDVFSEIFTNDNRYHAKRFITQIERERLLLSIIPNPELNRTLTLFPNPASNHLFFMPPATSKTIRSFRITTINGQIIKIGTLHNSRVDIQELASGQYVIELYSESEIFTSQFFKF